MSSSSQDPLQVLVEELAEPEKTVSFKESAPIIKEKSESKKERRQNQKDEASILRLEKIVSEEHAKEAKNVGKAAAQLGTAAEKLASAKKTGAEVPDSPENRTMYRSMVLEMQKRLGCTPIKQRFTTAEDYKTELDAYKNELAMKRANTAFATAIPKLLETLENINKKMAIVLLPMGINIFSPVSLKETFDVAVKKDELLADALVECSILYSPWFKTSPTMYVSLAIFTAIQDVIILNSTNGPSTGPPPENKVDPNLYPDL